VSLAAAIPAFARRHERALALVCALEIAVLVLAASGLLVVNP
jgi:transcriptional regulator GlxA family with amidase domain